MSKNIKSIEQNIIELCNGWLKEYGLNYKSEQEELNSEIDKALNKYNSKSGEKGGNRPDTKLLLEDNELNKYPILIEYKGLKNKLAKLDNNGQVENKTSKNEPHYKNISTYAVNGAIHYANALLHHTSYTDIIAIGITGYKTNDESIQLEIGVYLVSKSNLGIGQEIGKYHDLSFLNKDNFNDFINHMKSLSLTDEELNKLKIQREKELDASLIKLNNDIYNNEKGLAENDTVYIVVASIMATLGVPGKVEPLDKSELTSLNEEDNRDGDILLRKIRSFLLERNIPLEKRNLIIRILQNTLCSDHINTVINGETQLKRIFTKIVDGLGIYYKIGLATDFTGKLFNAMYNWVGFSQDKLNDVVLTPSYVSTLLAKLARINKDSYVWDFATGSAGLLVAAMNEMLIDAKNSINNKHDLLVKENKIKSEQLLGIELLPSVYILGVLNMILMGDGSSNILNEDSLNYNGEYGYNKQGELFPANAFILNPPYSAPGNGMIFVEEAFKKMNSGFASVLIQHSAGSGKAIDFNKRILENNTLIASIKMPSDLFSDKASVQTYIYVFKIGESHHEDNLVKFIDFSNDGYTRSSRKKSSNNLKDTDNAVQRYQELVDLVRFGKHKLNLFSEQDYYENTIDLNNGADWNQSSPIDTMPTINDFKLTISNYLSWQVSTILNNTNNNGGF